MQNDTNIEVLTTIVTALRGLDPEAQKRTLQAVVTFLNIPWSTATYSSKDYEIVNKDLPIKKDVSFLENRDISAKEFLKEKAPQKDIERIACLAYYITHYRNVPHFKTIDLSTLNTEAAQPKFSNATMAVDNATKAGFLAPATKGSKQISAVGEVFVQALPNRELARESISNLRLKRRAKKAAPKVQK